MIIRAPERNKKKIQIYTYEYIYMYINICNTKTRSIKNSKIIITMTWLQQSRRCRSHVASTDSQPQVATRQHGRPKQI